MADRVLRFASPLLSHQDSSEEIEIEGRYGDFNYQVHAKRWEWDELADGLADSNHKMVQSFATEVENTTSYWVVTDVTLPAGTPPLNVNKYPLHSDVLSAITLHSTRPVWTKWCYWTKGSPYLISQARSFFGRTINAYTDGEIQSSATVAETLAFLLRDDRNETLAARIDLARHYLAVAPRMPTIAEAFLMLAICIESLFGHDQKGLESSKNALSVFISSGGEERSVVNAHYSGNGNNLCSLRNDVAHGNGFVMSELVEKYAIIYDHAQRGVLSVIRHLASLEKGEDYIEALQAKVRELGPRLKRGR